MTRLEIVFRQLVEERCREVDKIYLNLHKDEKPLAGVRMYMLGEFLAKDMITLLTKKRPK